MAVRDDFAAGEVLAAADLNDTFASKLDLAGGKILQIVRATDSTRRSTTSTSFTDITGMTITITPQKSDSAIIVLGMGMVEATTGANARFQITDSSNNALSGASDAYLQNPSTTTIIQVFQTYFGYSTPATTSAVTYKMRFRASSGGTATMYNDLIVGQMYAIEVSA